MNEKLYKFLKDPVKVSIPVSIVSLGIGIGIGYFISKRKKKVEIHVVPAVEKSFKEMEPEIKKTLADHEEKGKVKKRYAPKVVTVDDDFVDEKIKEILNKDEPPSIEVVAQNIFAANDDSGWDREKEEQFRTTEQPYIIHKDEFYAEERNYRQTTLTYYSGDDIMVDQEEVPMYNYNVATGPLRFGHGSGDANVFYVRNDKLRAEYEILKDPGMYSVEILEFQRDFEAENDETKGLKHSGPGKFREE
jgi:hypothetical protein